MPNRCQEIKQEYENLKSLKAEFDLELERATTKAGTSQEVKQALQRAKELKAILEQQRDALKEMISPYASDRSYEFYFSRLQEKLAQNQELSKRDLLFLYEINLPEGRNFDPRLMKLRQNRLAQRREDLIRALDCEPSQIAMSIDEIGPNTLAYAGPEADFDKPETLYQIPESISLSELDRLSQIYFLPADLTHLSPDLKQSLKKWEGSIGDYSTGTLVYDHLVRVRMSLYANNAETFKSKSLQSVGEDLYANNAETFEAEALQSVGWDLYANNAKTFKSKSFQSVGWNLNVRTAKTFKAEALQSVGWFLYAPNAETFEAEALRSVGGSLNANNAKTFKVSSSLEIELDLYIKEETARSTPNFSAIKVKGKIKYF